MKLTIIAFILMILVWQAYGQEAETYLYNEGMILASNGQYDSAVKAYNKAILLNGTNTDVWIAKGNALLMQGKYNESIESYKEAVRLNPSNTMVACALRNTGNGWAAINDSNHAPLNIDSVSQNENEIIIRYSSIKAKKVQSLLCTPDETFAGRYTFGASVGIESANIFVYMESQRMSPKDLVSGEGNLWILGIFET